MKALVSPILVGVLLAFSLGALVFFISVSGRKGMSKNETYELHITFDDASGLANRSRVVVAGIDVGRIEKIGLQGRKARVSIRISNQFTLYEDASVMKRSESLLGDSLLDIDPGTEGLRPLQDGDEIASVRMAPGMDQLMGTFQGIAEDTRLVTGALATTVTGDDGQAAIANVLKVVNESSLLMAQTLAQSSEQLARILAHLETLTRDMSRLSAAQEQQIATILANVRHITDDARVSVASLSGMVGRHDSTVDEAVESVRRSLERLDATLESAQVVAKGIEQGEGSVGKLLRDEELADSIAHTAKEATAFVDRLTGLKIEMGMRTEGHLQPQVGGTSPVFSAKHTIGAKIMPANSSRYYGVDAVSEPRGHVTRNIEREIIDGTAVSTITETWSDKLRLNAYLAQRWGPATFRVGLFESTGGVGADLDIIPGSLSLRADAFDFMPVTGGAPRVRTMLRYSFLNHFDLYAGADDLLNSANPGALRDPQGLLTGPGRSFFLGGGFHFSDEDIKAILVATGVPSF